MKRGKLLVQVGRLGPNEIVEILSEDDKSIFFRKDNIYGFTKKENVQILTEEDRDANSQVRREGR